MVEDYKRLQDELYECGEGNGVEDMDVFLDGGTEREYEHLVGIGYGKSFDAYNEREGTGSGSGSCRGYGYTTVYGKIIGDSLPCNEELICSIS